VRTQSKQKTFPDPEQPHLRPKLSALQVRLCAPCQTASGTSSLSIFPSAFSHNRSRNKIRVVAEYVVEKDRVENFVHDRKIHCLMKEVDGAEPACLGSTQIYLRSNHHAPVKKSVLGVLQRCVLHKCSRSIISPEPGSDESITPRDHTLDYLAPAQ
jgi:hypothetical protein